MPRDSWRTRVHYYLDASPKAPGYYQCACGALATPDNCTRDLTQVTCGGCRRALTQPKIVSLGQAVVVLILAVFALGAFVGVVPVLSVVLAIPVILWAGWRLVTEARR